MIGLYWWRPADPSKINLGDEVGRKLVEAISGGRVSWRTLAQCDMVGLGSLLQKAFGDADVLRRSEPIHVWGSGCILPKPIPPSIKYAYAAVRGPLTRCLIAEAPNLPIGDPGILVTLVSSKSAQQKYRWGIVPHHSHLKSRAIAELNRNTPGSLIIDVSDPDMLRTLRALSSCSRIASTSLHGLIFADAYGIPNVWLHPRPLHHGGTWKFIDYFASMGRDRFDPAPVPASRNLDDIAAEWLVEPKLSKVAQVQEALERSFPAFLR
jgi:hypothetical protein